VAHDFNNLLTVIIGGLDTVARSKATDTVRTNRALDMARHAAERARFRACPQTLLVGSSLLDLE
jgi:hypothetical protein